MICEGLRIVCCGKYNIRLNCISYWNQLKRKFKQNFVAVRSVRIHYFTQLTECFGNRSYYKEMND